MDQTVVPCPFLKRVNDKVVALALIIVFSPVFLICIIGMALNMLLCRQDRGTWLYREQRISEGKLFDVLKFRVLRQDIIAGMPADNQHARIYEEDLMNLTWAGRYLLKKWYFDELPQLFNILKGDMSIVGPRPWPLPIFKSQVERGLIYRNLIRAGWTGPAQLQKRKNRGYKQTSTTSEDLDLQYVDRCRNWPGWRLLIFDLTVLYQTIWVMLESRGLEN